MNYNFEQFWKFGDHISSPLKRCSIDLNCIQFSFLKSEFYIKVIVFNKYFFSLADYQCHPLVSSLSFAWQDSLPPDGAQVDS